MWQEFHRKDGRTLSEDWTAIQDIPQNKLSALSQKNFDRFAAYVTGELGIKMPDSKMTMVQSRLMRRTRELQLDSIDDYGRYFFATESSEERQHLINAITTNKTDFFREPEHFDYLVKTALPKLRAGIDPRMFRLNVWSAACSSGQEVYTLAMVLSEYGAHNGGPDFDILGTDISTKVLEQARQAVYAEALLEPVPFNLRNKYMLSSKDRTCPMVRIKPVLRAKARFRQLNFMNESYGISDMFDIAFCRNVLIYFDRETQEAVIRKICRNIKPGGYLFVGHSESLSGMDLPVRQVTSAVFRKALGSEKQEEGTSARPCHPIRRSAY
jgi:chemotaxis protein methyltransferase CheR